MRYYSRKKIRDEFAHLAKIFSRQRVYQLRRAKNKECMICGSKDLQTKYCCYKHSKQRNILAKKWHHKKGLHKNYRKPITSYKPSGKGNHDGP